MRIARLLPALSLLLALGARAPLARAEVPSALIYQGALFDGDVAAEGEFNVRFKLFSAKSGGSELSSFDAGQVNIERGGFSVDVRELFASVAASELFLEVSVKSTLDDKYDVLPRVPVSSVPFTLRAKVADEVDWANVKNAPTPLQGPQGVPVCQA